MLKEIKLVIFGIIKFYREGTTPFESYLALRNIFHLTKGFSHRILNLLLRKKPYFKTLPWEGGLVATRVNQTLPSMVKRLKKSGFLIIENFLNEKEIEEVYKFAMETPAIISPLNGQDNRELPEEKIDFDNLKGIRYTFKEEEIIRLPVVQKLMTDKNLLQVAEAYFGGLPIATGLSTWWNTDYSSDPNDYAATMWHVDLDNIRWLKFFFYISDVTESQGPHSFVESSHKPNSLPVNFYKDRRYSNEEVTLNFEPNRIKEFVGKAGTLIIEDTIGLHKGKHVISGARLLLQITFASTTFGANYPPAPCFTKDMWSKNDPHLTVFKKYIPV